VSLLPNADSARVTFLPKR